MNACMQFLLPASYHLLRRWRNMMWNKTRVILKPAELQALGPGGPTATCDSKTNISGTNLPKWPDFSPNHCFHSGEPSALRVDIPVLLLRELHFTGYVVLHQSILWEAVDCIPDHCEWETVWGEVRNSSSSWKSSLRPGPDLPAFVYCSRRVTTKWSRKSISCLQRNFS